MKNKKPQLVIFLFVVASFCCLLFLSTINADTQLSTSLAEIDQEEQIKQDEEDHQEGVMPEVKFVKFLLEVGKNFLPVSNY